jgi:hypothetical protein
MKRRARRRFLWSVTVVGIVSALAAIAWNTPGRPEPVYKPGDYVSHQLDGRIGLVISFDYETPRNYIVRFSISQLTTNTRLFEADQPVKISPYADVKCAEFELQPGSHPTHSEAQ